MIGSQAVIAEAKEIERGRLREAWDAEERLCLEWPWRVVVSLSGGNGSAVALFRCLEIYGPGRVFPVFADTNSEDADLYRFLDDVERVSGVRIHRLTNGGRTTRDVFDKSQVIRIYGACKASVELKAKPLDKYIGENFHPAYHVRASGMDWSEPDRMARLRRGNAKRGYRSIFPLCVRPRLDACGLQDFLRSRGIEPCKLYGLGYPHNNCGGKCVIAGQGQWVGVLQDFPDDFDDWQRWETEFVAKHGFTILNRRSTENGKVVRRNYSLAELREDASKGRRFQEFRSGCGCFLDAMDASDDA